MGIKVYETPTGKSEVNGQIERFHSTLVEIYRCLRTDGISASVTNLIKLSVDKYNKTIHSVIDMTPFEACYGKQLTPNDTSISQQRDLQNQLILSKLKIKRLKDRNNQNKKRDIPRVYEPGEEILIKNKQISSKQVNPKKSYDSRKESTCNSFG